MDSHQLSSYRVTDAGLPYTSSCPNPAIPSRPNRLPGSLKFDTGNSPSSPFSTHFDSDTLSALSDCQQLSSGEILSGASRSCNSPLETNHYMHRSISSVDRLQGSPQLYSARTSLLQDAASNQKAKHALTTSDNSLGESSRTPTSVHRYRSWSHDHEASQFVQSQPSFVNSKRKLSESAHVEKRHKSMEEPLLQGFLPSDLKQLLNECAKALSENNMQNLVLLIEKARSVVSITGEPIQRLGAYIVEGLVARKEASGNNIYHALRYREQPEGKDLLSYMQKLYEICPYLKFGYMAANGAIAGACRNEDRIHIIDFQIAQGAQWVTLLQALAARPGGAPQVRITGIDDPFSKFARGDGLEAVGKRLAIICEKFGIPFEFHGVPVYAPDVTRNMLDVRPGEALAINFPLQLHHTADESVDVNNPRDGLLRMVKSLSPKVTTLMEQESNTNTTPFFHRFMETLDYYLAMFESIDITLPRTSKERIYMEQYCLARDIVNVIACEGKERVERHELFGKWKSRLTMAGFRQYPLCPYVNSVIRSLLRCYSEHYTLLEKEGAILLGWKNRSLISASAWY